MTAETLLSGPGLVRLYRALAFARKVDHRIDTPSEIVESGLSGKDPLTTETLHLFCRLLGRFAGDLALVFGATGGVFMAAVSLCGWPRYWRRVIFAPLLKGNPPLNRS